MKKLMVFLMILITLPMAFALGNNFNFTSKEGTVQINGSDVCIIETGQCMSSLAGGISYTAGSGIVVSGGVITATSINGTGTGGGNSNETLWAMFANLTQIMDNITIYNMINGVTENDTDTWNSNISVNHYLNTYFANLTQIMNNHTIYDMINAVSDNDTNNYINNDTLSNAISNTTIIHLGNTSWVRNLISGLKGLVYDASTGQLTATAVNGTSNAMNNETVYNMINLVSDNDTNTWNSNESIRNYLENGTIVRNINTSWITENQNNYINANESVNHYLNTYYANLSQIMNNVTISEMINITLGPRFMNITGGRFTGDVNVSKNFTAYYGNDAAEIRFNGSTLILKGVSNQLNIW